MTNKKHNIVKKNVKRFAIFALATAVLAGLAFVGFLAPPSFIKETPTRLASLSGFESGAAVSVKVLSENAPTLHTEKQISENGTLTLANLDPANPGDIYSFAIQEIERQLSVRLQQEPETETLSIKGKGCQPFSDIKIEAGDQVFQTRADWAGMFEQTGIDPKALNGQEEAIRLAFYNNDIASDGREYQNPAIIEVYSAPGGGGPTDDRVNEWEETNCAPYPLSTCDTDRVNDQNEKIVENFVHPLILMTEQLSFVVMKHVATVGMFLDAKDQLEAGRLQQQLKAEAHKDYYPSEQMCRIGSYMKSLATIEEKVSYTQLALNDLLIAKEMNRKNTAAHLGPETNFSTRFEQYKTTYCDPNDNNGGLDMLCKHSAGVGTTEQERINKDIDYARTAEFPYTLDVDFTDSALSEDEEDIIALAQNLYWPESFQFFSEKDAKKNPQAFARTRAFRALNNLAYNSFSHYVALKAKAPDPTVPNVRPGWAHMKVLLLELGLSSTDIEELIGTNPSYYAQMDILTKRIYQNPDFYTDLYDKPTNVTRVNTSLDAIKLMQMRDHYEASLRREMLLSGLLENELITDAGKIQGVLYDLPQR